MTSPNNAGGERPAILAVEDSPTQAEKLRHILEGQGYRVSLAENGRKALAALDQELPALVVSDIVMPEMDGYQLCRSIKMDNRTKHIPVILLTSLTKSEDVLEGLECGADYFITKPYSERYLLDSIEQILLDRKLHYQDRMRIGTEIIVNGKTRLINTDQQQTLSLLISTYEAAVRTNTELLQTQNDLRSLNVRLEDLVDERTIALREEIIVRRQSEERVRHLNLLLRAIRGVNRLIVNEKDPARLVQGVCQILMERRGYENAFIFLKDVGGGPMVFTEDGLHQAFKDQGGEPQAFPRCCQEAKQSKGIFHVTDRPEFCLGCPLGNESTPSDVLCSLLHHEGKEYGYLAVAMDSIMAMDDENRDLFAEIAADIALALYNIEQGEAVQQAEKDKQCVEAELRQAQKMEAVGRLASGVAHDFNNMLGVILGYAGMTLSKLDSADPLYEYVSEIEKAGERSAELSKQLLAFSSRQMVTPKVIDLNQSIANLQKMLVRLVGEDIEFQFLPGESLWSLLIDLSQVNQILANLAVNARDAISETGTITIETSNVILDEEYCRRFANVAPGEYVSIAFSDTGMGMDAALVSHIFEPFFTTKEEGKGTGLGLSTVFGIVKQYDGFIHTYSEPGMGTTFKIYLPRFIGQAEAPSHKIKKAPVQGNETVLIVEDEKQVLALAKAVLESCGYRALTANTPNEALQLLKDYTEEIHLLLTDVIMPEMNGKELQKNVLEIRPQIKTLFMSGYTADAIVHRGMLEKGVQFISKPFTINAMIHKVREALGAKR
ncbi:MAG: response regulator [Pseudomonadota bacterium]